MITSGKPVAYQKQKMTENTEYNTKREIRRHPRTKFTLENYLRVLFLPTGVREFMKGVNYELNLGPIQSKIYLGIATSMDIVKCISYATWVYNHLK